MSHTIRYYVIRRADENGDAYILKDCAGLGAVHEFLFNTALPCPLDLIHVCEVAGVPELSINL